MFLNRAGKFFLLVCVGTFVLRYTEVISLPSRIGMMIGGIGLGMIVLGSLFGGSTNKRRPSRGAPYSPGTAGRTPGYSVNPVQVVGQTIPAAPRLCTSCQNPLRPGARFCTRCGVAAVQPPPIVAPLPPAPRSVATPRSPAAPKRKGGFPFVRIVLLLAACFYGYGYYVDWQNTGRLPWDGWHWPRELSEAISTSINESESAPLPVAPEPGNPAPAIVGPGSGAYIDHAWVVTGAMNDQGYVGLGVHAVIHTCGVEGLRFAAHFRYDDSAPLYAVGPQYADPNGHAAAAIIVPDAANSIEVTAFIPYTALSLRASAASLQLLPSLYDSNNQQLGACQPVPFTVYRGSIYITRVRLDSNSRVGSYHGPNRKLLVSFHSSEMHGVVGKVTVRFKDDHGMTVEGQFDYARPPGELQVSTGFNLSASHGDVAMDDLPVDIPSGIVPPRATAEISLYDARSGIPLPAPISFKMP